MGALLMTFTLFYGVGGLYAHVYTRTNMAEKPAPIRNAFNRNFYRPVLALPIILILIPLISILILALYDFFYSNKFILI